MEEIEAVAMVVEWEALESELLDAYCTNIHTGHPWRAVAIKAYQLGARVPVKKGVSQ